MEQNCRYPTAHHQSMSLHERLQNHLRQRHRYHRRRHFPLRTRSQRWLRISPQQRCEAVIYLCFVGYAWLTSTLSRPDGFIGNDHCNGRFRHYPQRGSSSHLERLQRKSAQGDVNDDARVDDAAMIKAGSAGSGLVTIDCNLGESGSRLLGRFLTLARFDAL